MRLLWAWSRKERSATDDMLQRLLLIDGNALFYRAFFAIRELSRSDGQATNALYGFIRMLDAVQREWRPSHWYVAFDGGLPPRRMEALETYKAQRPETPAALRSQYPLLEQYLDAAHVPWGRTDQEEADDVLASLAEGAKQAGCDDIVLIGWDKDLFQLVGGPVRIAGATAGSHAMGREEVKQKTGVWPEQIIDWLALVGDSSDNIPGVPGVGPKTAGKLLETFGGLHEMWPRLEEVTSASLRKKLATHRETVERNCKLVRLARELNVQPPNWDALACRAPDIPRVLSFFESVEFHAMAKALRQPEMLF